MRVMMLKFIVISVLVSGCELRPGRYTYIDVAAGHFPNRRADNDGDIPAFKSSFSGSFTKYASRLTMRFIRLLFCVSACFALLVISNLSSARLVGIDRIVTFEDCGSGVGNSIGCVTDTTAPVITLIGSATINITVGDTYNDAGATALDDTDGNITNSISTTNSVNANAVGAYTVTYNVNDAASNAAIQVTRNVNVNSAPAAGVLAFTDLTTTIIDTAPHITFHFYAGMPDVNGDGCLDMYLGSHGDATDSAMYIQSNVSGACQGTFTYYADNNNYSQASPQFPRITSRYIWGNWYDHPKGFWSFFGADVDGSASARYIVDPAFTTVGGLPIYLTKDGGCHGDRPKCLPLDIDGDNQLEMVSRLYGAPYNTAYIVDIDTGATIYTPTSTASTFTDGLAVFDVDNDGEPEIIHIWQGGYFDFNGSTLDFIANKFSSTPEQGDKHSVVLDYDSDGDMDYFMVDGIYDSNGVATPTLFQNDGVGNFTDVTSTALAGITLNNVAYWTTYSNSVVADVDLDGYPDILFGGETSGNNVTVLRNNGNGTFTADRTVDFGRSDVGFSGKNWLNAGDYDNDGLIDIVKTHYDIDATHASIGIFRNTMSVGNHWLRVRVRGNGENTDGLHSRISIFEAGTSNLITHYEVGAFSAGYQNLITHAGVADNTTVDVRVEYPHGGATCTFSNVSVDKDVIVYPTCNIANYTPGSEILLTYVAQASTVNTTMTLIADASVTATSSELVTFGLPFAEGDVTNLDEIKVSVGGNEIAAYVEQGLTWWSDNSIRSATIQIANVDMTAGNVTVTVTDEGFSTARNTEQTHSTGWVAAGSNKNNHLFPRIFAIHDLDYLASTNIIPPYSPAPLVQDAFEDYQVAQSSWAVTNFDYSASSRANWLFDRATANFKIYMTTGRTEFYKEAFLAKQFYYTYVAADGDFRFGSPNCAEGDGKYGYTQPAKLALALMGDRTQWDNAKMLAMAASSVDCQPYVLDTYDVESEAFTERAAGIGGLAELGAYEITGDASVLATVNARIASLKDMQQTVKSWDTANSWTPKSGAFTHSIANHEGDTYPGDGTTDDRGFSPWMSENIADFLWQSYWSIGHSDAPEMLRLLGNAVNDYGFSSTYNTTTDQFERKAEYAAQVKTQGCNTLGNASDINYFGSAVASNGVRTVEDWYQWYTDQHAIESVLTIAVGAYFETNALAKERLTARASALRNGWSNASCASVSITKRLYNWQHRSNSVRTFEWVGAQ